MQMLTIRRSYVLAIIAVICLLSFAGFLQVSQNIQPCPLCIIQRLIFFALLVFLVFSVIVINNKFLAWSGQALLTFSVFAGIAVASRQVWLQYLPAEQVPACGPGLNYLLDRFSLNETLHMVLQGSGECAEVHWTLFKLSLAEWSLICFVAFAILILVNSWRLAKLPSNQ